MYGLKSKKNTFGYVLHFITLLGQKSVVNLVQNLSLLRKCPPLLLGMNKVLLLKLT